MYPLQYCFCSILLDPGAAHNCPLIYLGTFPPQPTHSSWRSSHLTHITTFYTPVYSLLPCNSVLPFCLSSRA
ncbi:hypothetical protein DFH29DRAFT_977805 [Suillus ampliporus]|nr:hypothetical protein DFH29DRAFT_977805 [Suillus ampliporus]